MGSLIFRCHLIAQKLAHMLQPQAIESSKTQTLHQTSYWRNHQQPISCRGVPPTTRGKQQICDYLNLNASEKTNLHFAELVKLIFKSKDSNVLCLWLPQVEFMKYLFWNVLWQNPRQNNHTKMVISTRKTLWVTVQNSRKKNEAIDCYVSSWARRTLLRNDTKPASFIGSAKSAD